MINTIVASQNSDAPIMEQLQITESYLFVRFSSNLEEIIARAFTFRAQSIFLIIRRELMEII